MYTVAHSSAIVTSTPRSQSRRVHRRRQLPDRVASSTSVWQEDQFGEFAPDDRLTDRSCSGESCWDELLDAVAGGFFFFRAGDLDVIGTIAVIPTLHDARMVRPERILLVRGCRAQSMTSPKQDLSSRVPTMVRAGRRPRADRRRRQAKSSVFQPRPPTLVESGRGGSRAACGGDESRKITTSPEVEV